MAGLPDATRIGAVELTVRDLDTQLAFYRAALGLRELDRRGGTVTLGGAAPVVRLVHDPSAPPRPPRATGLYHMAILFPARADLARAVLRLLEHRWPIQGASDHDVSEAVYLADPEENGIEIYADRPRDTWRWRDGAIEMSTRALDVDDLLDQAGEERPRHAPEGTRMGHVHLMVADVPAAEAFYRDALGFDVTTRYGAQASFLSAGRYHHHVAVNAWASLGAPPPPPGAQGLRRYEAVVPDAAALDDAEARLRKAGAAHERTFEGLATRDPSGNAVVLRAEPR